MNESCFFLYGAVDCGGGSPRQNLPLPFVFSNDDDVMITCFYFDSFLYNLKIHSEFGKFNLDRKTM